MPNITTVDPIVLPPGVKAINLPCQKVFDGQVFPLILVPDGDETRDWQTWLKDNMQIVKDLLLKFATIVFRDFKVESAKNFDDFCKAFDYEEYNYKGNFANRTHVVGHVYTANDAEGRVIPFHHELVHLKEKPCTLFFYCEYPSATEGETPIVLSNIVYREMAVNEPEFVRRLHREEISAIRVLPESDDIKSYLGTSWKSSFQAKTREQAEVNAKATGHYDLDWQSNGSLRCKTPPVPGTRVDRKTGKVMFFNYVHTAYEGLDDKQNLDPKRSAIFKNGEFMEAKTMESLHQALWGNCVQLPWKSGDVMVIDNIQVQHARNDFSGPRRILASMYKDNSQRLL